MRDSNRSIISVIAQRPARALTCAALAVAFATTPLVSPTAAYAVSAETQAELAAAESQVDQYAAFTGQGCLIPEVCKSLLYPIGSLCGKAARTVNCQQLHRLFRRKTRVFIIHLHVVPFLSCWFICILFILAARSARTPGLLGHFSTLKLFHQTAVLKPL